MTYLGPDTSLVVVRRDTEGLKGGQDDEDGRPTVVEREGEVDEELVGDRARRVMLLDDIVDVGDSRADKEGEDESCAMGWWTGQMEEERASVLGYSAEGTEWTRKSIGVITGRVGTNRRCNGG